MQHAGELNSDNIVNPKGIDLPSQDKVNQSGGLFYENGKVLLLDCNNNVSTINSNPPHAEWYDLVELAKSPVDNNEVWLTIGGRELYLSRDNALTFTRISNINHIADISFIPWLNSDNGYVLHIVGVLEDGKRGTFISNNYGLSWLECDLSAFKLQA